MKAHCGIAGNELADTAAKEATKRAGRVRVVTAGGLQQKIREERSGERRQGSEKGEGWLGLQVHEQVSQLRTEKGPFQCRESAR